jgi:biopolymer transport protein TolR
MGANIDTGDGKSVDVQINITPFIDLLSCLTAFLLVTAAWSNLAQISIKPKGVSRTSSERLMDEDPVRASILIQDNTIWVGLSRINDFRQIKKEDEDYNWPALKELLEEHRQSTYFTNPDREDIEIAAEEQISYQTIISVMDTAIAAGFIDVGLADPASLSARPQL